MVRVSWRSCSVFSVDVHIATMENKNEDKNPKFISLKGMVSKETLQAIKQMGFKRMTDIQSEVLPPSLDGEDIVATAKTGSGKTLAFLIPAVEIVYKNIAKEVQGNFTILKNKY